MKLPFEKKIFFSFIFIVTVIAVMGVWLVKVIQPNQVITPGNTDYSTDSINLPLYLLLLSITVLVLITFFIVRNSIITIYRKELLLQEFNDVLEQKVQQRTEEAVQQEKKFHAVVENSFDIITMYDKNFEIIYLSPSFERITGFSAKERKAGNDLDFTHPNDIEKGKELMLSALANPGRPLFFQNRMRHKKGNYIWVEGVIVNFLDDVNVNAIISNYRDITERKNAEDDASLLINNTQESFVLVDKDLQIVNFNKQFKDTYIKFFGKEVTKGDSILNYTEPERKTILENIYSKVLGGETFETETPVTEKETGTCFYLNTFRPAYNEGGNIAGVFVTSVNITEKKETQHNIIKSEKRFRALVENATDIIAMFDGRGNLLYAGPSLEKITGFNLEELKIQNGYMLVHPDDLEQSKSIEQQLIKAPGIPVQRTFKFTCKGGGFVWLEGTVTNLLDDENVMAVVANFRDITKRKEDEEELRKSEERYRYLFYNNPMPMFIYDFKTLEIIEVNDAALIKYGYTEEEFLSLTIKDIRPIEDIPLMEAAVKDESSYEKVRRHRWRHLKKNGELMNMFITSNLIDYKSRRCVLSLLDDITEELRAEQLLQLSNERLKMAQQIAHIGYWEIDKTTNISYWSEEMYRIFELSTTVMPSRKEITDMIHEADRQMFEDAIANFIQHDQPLNIEYRLEKKWRTPKYLVTRANKIKDSNGKLLRIEGTTQDISQQKQLELSLTQSEARFRSSFEYSAVGMALVSLEGLFKEVNESFCEIIGYAKQEVLRLNFKDITYPDDLDTDLKLLQELVEGKRKTYQMEKRYFHKNGEIVCVLLNVSMVSDVNNQPLHFISQIKNITERKKSEKDFIKLFEEKNTILESITDGFFTTDANWIVKNWNPMAEELTGIAKKDILGTHLWEKYEKELPPEFYTELTNANNQQQATHFETYLPLLNAWFSIAGYPSEFGLSVFFRNITEQKRLEKIFTLEKEVLELNAKPNTALPLIIKHLLQGIEKIHSDNICGLMKVENNKIYNWLSSPKLPPAFIDIIEGEEIGPNRGSCGTAAYLQQTVIAEDISTSPLWASYKQVALSHGLKACWSFPIISGGETIATFVVYNTYIKKPSASEINTLERARNILVTIIENKRSERELQVSNERYNIVAEATNDTIWDWDIDNDKVFWNEGTKKMFGFDVIATTSSNWWKEKIHDEDRDRVMNKINYHIENGVRNWFDEYRFLCVDGSYKYVYDRGFVLLNSEGKPIKMIGAMQDITVQKKHELQLSKLNHTLQLRAKDLVDSNTELERFAYVASHDLQEPLRMVSSFMQLLKVRYDKQLDDKAREYIHFAVDGAERMQRLILDLLEYSRVNTIKADFEEVDLNEIFSEVHLNISNVLTLKNATIHATPLPVVKAIKIQMLQLLQNLAGNAIKYQHPNRKALVCISAAEQEQEWVIAVKDNGIGIDQKFEHKIFQIFQRLHTKTEYTGTGIGLAICKKIIDKHRGKIWVESDGKNGSTFYFTIPK